MIHRNILRLPQIVKEEIIEQVTRTTILNTFLQAHLFSQLTVLCVIKSMNHINC